MQPFHIALENELLPQLSRRQQAWSRITQHLAFPSVYVALLANTYHYVKQSCPLMERAKSRLVAAKYPRFLAFLERHIEDEGGHEQWVLQDLSAMGLSPQVALKTFPSAPACAMVGSQQYLIEEFGPFALLGYMYVLEAYPPRSEGLKALSRRFAIPPSAFSTLLEHADVDQYHRRDLIEIIDSDELFPHRELIAYSAELSAKQTTDLLTYVADLVPITLKEDSMIT